MTIRRREVSLEFKGYHIAASDARIQMAVCELQNLLGKQYHCFLFPLCRKGLLPRSVSQSCFGDLELDAAWFSTDFHALCETRRTLRLSLSTTQLSRTAAPIVINKSGHSSMSAASLFEECSLRRTCDEDAV